MAEQTNIRMTAAEFWQMTEHSDQRFELIDGEAILMGTPITDHQRAVGKCYLILTAISTAIGGEAFIAPLEVYLDDRNIPQPDAMWVAANSKCKVGTSGLEGAPDLVIEVFSPSTRQHDRVTKFRLYQKHGVREYWMIDPTAQYIEVWRHNGEGYDFFGVFKPGETFNSPVLNGQSIVVQSLFQ